MSLPLDSPPPLASGTILKRAEAAALLETVRRRLFYERIRMIKIFFIPFQIQYISQMEGLWSFLGRGKRKEDEERMGLRMRQGDLVKSIFKDLCPPPSSPLFSQSLFEATVGEGEGGGKKC